MYRLRPSFETDASSSTAAEFTTGPRLTGSDHGEYLADDADGCVAAGGAVGPRSSGSAMQPASMTTARQLSGDEVGIACMGASWRLAATWKGISRPRVTDRTPRVA